MSLSLPDTVIRAYWLTWQEAQGRKKVWIILIQQLSNRHQRPSFSPSLLSAWKWWAGKNCRDYLIPCLHLERKRTMEAERRGCGVQWWGGKDLERKVERKQNFPKLDFTDPEVSTVVIGIRLWCLVPRTVGESSFQINELHRNWGMSLRKGHYDANYTTDLHNFITCCSQLFTSASSRWSSPEPITSFSFHRWMTPTSRASSVPRSETQGSLRRDKRTSVSCSVISNSLQPHGLEPATPLCPWGFSRQAYWIELPFPSPGDLSNPGIKPGSPTLQADS